MSSKIQEPEEYFEKLAILGQLLGIVQNIGSGIPNALSRIVTESFTKTIGSAIANKLVDLSADMIGKAVEGIKNTTGTNPARHEIFNALKKEDPILANADNKTLVEAYNTMTRVAPMLSTDKNAVRSFLTQAAVGGGGLDYNTIRGIAEAENAVMKARNPK